MLSGEGLALGASGAIYGLLAMAMIWAPRNSMNCFVLLGFRPISFEIPILVFVGLYVGWEVVALWLGDFQMSSAVLHLAGAVPGFAVAAVMLKAGLVDCENFDLFAVMSGREGQDKPEKLDLKHVAEAHKKRDSMRASAMAHLAHQLKNGQAAEALALDAKMTTTDPGWHLTQELRLELIKGLHKARLWSQSVAPMVEFLRRAPDPAPRVRLKLAQILIQHENRPGRALSVLERIPAGSLPPDLEKARKQLAAQARKMYDEGEIEVDDEEW
jgi:hypothetical protein